MEDKNSSRVICPYDQHHLVCANYIEMYFCEKFDRKTYSCTLRHKDEMEAPININTKPDFAKDTILQEGEE